MNSLNLEQLVNASASHSGVKTSCYCSMGSEPALHNRLPPRTPARGLVNVFRYRDTDIRWTGGFAVHQLSKGKQELELELYIVGGDPYFSVVAVSICLGSWIRPIHTKLTWFTNISSYGGARERDQHLAQEVLVVDRFERAKRRERFNRRPRKICGCICFLPCNYWLKRENSALRLMTGLRPRLR